MTTRSLPGLVLVVSLFAPPAAAASPSPEIPSTPHPSPSATLPTAPTPTATPIAPSPTATRARPAPSATPASRTDAGARLDPHANGVEAVATTLVAPPRAFRTPERAAPPAFVAPQGQAAPDAAGDGAVGRAPTMEPRPAPRAGSNAVVFRVTARTAVEGFDLRIGYPRTAGSFGTGAHQAECTAGTGLLVMANDRGDGEMRLLVASAQPLPFPIDVFCPFATEPGAGVGAGDFAVRVAEVTSDGKRADPGLLLVSVVVR